MGFLYMYKRLINLFKLEQDTYVCVLYYEMQSKGSQQKNRKCSCKKLFWSFQVESQMTFHILLLFCYTLFYTKRGDILLTRTELLFGRTLLSSYFLRPPLFLNPFSVYSSPPIISPIYSSISIIYPTRLIIILILTSV